ncbi:Man1-Src1p-C-terminal domain-domain-containing protein [Coniella lustricola]|uniref:Man1-Src1p-C-terminal domain-domain-containing protein n=1 Tax=Coniella lustricola TaxID=2025994 RepID=A0A2T3ACH6_9PEZI|nr:Man1-Src1p-C-terminal domain-domain-containing protein [Coniella lustricola]
MSDSEVDYLQPDFDPASVTMPRLRSILVSHNISYPATAKKAQLVEIFNAQVVPQAKKILDRRARAKRSSMGITNIDNSDGYSVNNDDVPPPPSTSRVRGRSKKTTGSAASSFKTHSEEPEQTPVRRQPSPRKRSSRSASHQLGFSDTDNDSHYDAHRSPRKTPRRAELTPQPEIKIEETEYDRDNVFSNENPFQGGSSPTSVVTPVSRKRTPGVESAVKRPVSSSSRGCAKSNATSRLRSPPSLQSSPSPPGPEPALEADQIEAGEEFTPEEQLALSLEDAARAQTAMVPHMHQKKPNGFNTPLRVLLLALLGAYGAWYRQEKIAVGYCGVGRPDHEIVPRHISYKDINVEVPDWAIKLAEPECEPCPPHAYCYRDNSVRCEDDYILKPHPLSAGGLIPLPPTCEPDGEKARRVKAVADKAVEELRERRAKFECGELVDDRGHQPATPAITVEELKEVVSEQRSKKLSKKEFDDLWSAALGEIESRDEIHVEQREDPKSHDPRSVSDTYLSSVSLARLPLSCAVRRSVILGLERHKLSIVSIITSLLTLLYGRSRYRANRAIAGRIPALVDLVLDRLATQKELAYEEADGDDPFLFLPNMRDDVLRSIHRLAERERIWQRVRAVVEQNTNVRTGQREGKNGEVGRAWEWIGPSGVGEPGARRRRIAYAGGGEYGAVERMDPHTQWEEPGSRPFY